MANEGYIEESDLVKDGRKGMMENPNPKKYWVVRSRADNSVRKVFRPSTDDLSELDDYRKKSSWNVVAEWHRDDETASKVLGYKFPVKK